MKYGWIAGLLAFAMLISGWCTVAVADENSPYLTGTFTLPSNREHSVQNLTDDNDRTRLTLTSGQSMDVEWNGEAEGILICWYNTDNRVTISLFDEMEGILRKTEYRETPYRMFIPAAGARKLTITCEKNNMASICELRICRAGYVPSCVTEQPDWDLMLVLSSTSEETDLLGGLLPLYAGEHGIRTGVIYIGIDYGYRVQEAFRALQTMGLDITPVFLRMDEQATCSIDRMGYFWSENKLKEQLVGLMNRYRPKVVVTCDPDDTVSMVRAPYTARLMDSIIRQYSQRGELSVQKFYQLSDKGTTHMNWTTPLVTYQGRTAQEVAKAGYACYQTESSYGTIIPSSTTFRLAYSSVGEDVLCNDLMEHIDLDTLLVYQVPTPTPMPTLTPTVMPTEEPIVEPTDSPASTPSPKAHSTIVPTEEASTVSLTQQQTTSTGWGYLWIILALLAIVGGIVFVIQKKFTFAIIAGCIAIMLLLLGIRTMRAPSGEGELKKGTEQEQPVKPTDSPTAEPTEKPTEK
ncbi:MAG: PIG-L family deacetylase, partial [Clostridia bacterium]|nr:PIG-L family deacetylase [Clostridia bacterium]